MHFMSIGYMTIQLAAGLSIGQQIWDMVVLIFVFIFVVFLAYYSVRLMGRAKNARGGGNIKVIEAAPLGFQNTVQLIKAGGKYFLIGVSKNGITFIGEVDEKDLNFESSQLSPISFDKLLSKFLKKEGDVQKDNKEGNDR